MEMNPERVVYVSCDSATLARDVKWLSENGYKLKEVTPCDMFGQTTHVECVVALHRSICKNSLILGTLRAFLGLIKMAQIGEKRHFPMELTFL